MLQGGRAGLFSGTGKNGVKIHINPFFYTICRGSVALQAGRKAACSWWRAAYIREKQLKGKDDGCVAIFFYH